MDFGREVRLRVAATRVLNGIKWLAIAVQTLYSIYAVIAGIFSGDFGGGLIRAVLSYVALLVFLFVWSIVRTIVSPSTIRMG